jgi:phenylacetate-CoA ligase
MPQRNSLPNPLDSWSWNRQQLAQWQIEQFNHQLSAVLPANSFYADKLKQAGISANDRLKDLSDLQHWPITTKSELSENSQPSDSSISRHHTYPTQDYSRLHRTSGTRGEPLIILDTADDWQWWSDTWQHVLQAAEVTSQDRVFLAFSFGPFIGFWSAHQACVDRGAMVIPGGGLSTLARLEFIRQSQANIVCCTPSYALHMAEVAQAENYSLTSLGVDRLIVAGEAGGSVPEVRAKISDLWRGKVIDHAGATEIGPWGFGWQDRCGLHVIETSFIAEVLPLKSDGGNHSDDNVQMGELVLTSLGRWGAPVIRYRTGDIVRLSFLQSHSTSCGFAWLPDGVIGRADDMVTIRGVNIFPSSIDSIVRSLSNIGEYQVQVWREGQLDQLSLTVEGSVEDSQQLEKQLLLKTGLRMVVQNVAIGSLPRSEAKSKRWIDRR